MFLKLELIGCQTSEKQPLSQGLFPPHPQAREKALGTRLSENFKVVVLQKLAFYYAYGDMSFTAKIKSVLAGCTVAIYQ